MSEEDIKLQYITPSIVSKWSREKITMETRITDGRLTWKIILCSAKNKRRADYILYLNADNPIAEQKGIVEKLEQLIPFLSSWNEVSTKCP